MRPSSVLLFAGLACGCFAITLHAQTSVPQAVASQPQNSVSVIHANSRAVVVDVVVTKGLDEPVATLHKQDFQLMEDGKPQPIDFFEEHTAAVAPSIIKPVPMPPNVYTNVPAAPPTDSVNILLIDSLNTDREDQNYVLRQVREFFKTMQPNAQVAIFTLGSKLRLIQGFTADDSILQSTLNDKKYGPSLENPEPSRSLYDKFYDQVIVGLAKGVQGSESAKEGLGEAANFKADDRVAATLQALQYLGRYLAGVPGRKNLIWFAGSFPVTVFPSTKEKLSLDQIRQYSAAVRQTADLLTVSKVAVYPVSAEGMMSDHMIMMGGMLPGEWGPLDIEDADVSNKAAQDAPQRITGFFKPYVDEAAARSAKMAAMEQLAADTGGEAIFNNNDLAAATSRAIDNGSHYYTLVYTPANKKMDGQYRRIEVKLALKPSDGKYKLAYRRGYYADTAQTQIAEAQPSGDPAQKSAAAPDPKIAQLRSMMGRGMPSATEILYGVRVLPTAPQPEPTAKPVGYNPKLPKPTTRYAADFLIDPKKVQLQATSDGKHTGMIRVELLAYDHDGKALNWTGQTMGMSFDTQSYAAIQSAGIPAHLEIDVPNTDVYLSTGIYDLEAGKAGTLEIPLKASAQTASR